MWATREAMYAQVTIRNVTATPTEGEAAEDTQAPVGDLERPALAGLRHENNPHDRAPHDTTSDASRPVIRWKTRSKSS